MHRPCQMEMQHNGILQAKLLGQVQQMCWWLQVSVHNFKLAADSFASIDNVAQLTLLPIMNNSQDDGRQHHVPFEPALTLKPRQYPTSQ